MARPYVEFYNEHKTLCYQWWAYDAFMESGDCVRTRRQTPDDVWSPPMLVTMNISLAAVEKLAGSRGCTNKVDHRNASSRT